MVNVQGTVKVLELAKKFEVKKFVYAASASCYGMTKKLTNENYNINIIIFLSIFFSLK